MGISYRVVFRRDPIPGQSEVKGQAHPHHVHGAVYLVEGGCTPGLQPKIHPGQQDLSEHDLEHYSGAVSANCKRHLARQRSSGQQVRHVYVLLICLLVHLFTGRYQQKPMIEALARTTLTNAMLCCTGGVCRARLDKKCMLSCRKAEKQQSAAHQPQQQPPVPSSSPPAPKSPPSISRLASLDEEAAEEAELAGESRVGMMPILASGIQHMILDSATVSKNAVISAVTGLRKRTPGQASSAPAVQTAQDLSSAEGKEDVSESQPPALLLPPDDLFGKLTKDEDEQMCQLYDAAIEAAQPVQTPAQISTNSQHPTVQVAELTASPDGSQQSAAATNAASNGLTANVPHSHAPRDQYQQNVSNQRVSTTDSASMPDGQRPAAVHAHQADVTSLQASLDSHPAAVIPDEVMNGVADMAVQQSGMLNLLFCHAVRVLFEACCL